MMIVAGNALRELFPYPGQIDRLGIQFGGNELKGAARQRRIVHPGAINF